MKRQLKSRTPERSIANRSCAAKTVVIGASAGIVQADIAALAVHIMINTALTGATYDVDGGQQLVG